MKLHDQAREDDEPYIMKAYSCGLLDVARLNGLISKNAEKHDMLHETLQKEIGRIDHSTYPVQRARPSRGRTHGYLVYDERGPGTIRRLSADLWEMIESQYQGLRFLGVRLWGVP